MNKWKTWLGLAVSVAAVAYAVRGVEWGAVGGALVGADLRLLALTLVLSPIVNIGMRAVRWRILLRPTGRVRLASCTSATAIGLMANNVLPARIGEFVRAYALGKRENVPTGTAFGTVFVERMFDFLSIVLFIYVLTLIHPFPDWVDTTARIALYIFVGMLAFQMFLAFHPRRFIRVAVWFARRLFGGRFEDPLERLLVSFVDGFHLLRSPTMVVVSFAMAIVQWSLISFTYWIGFAAFGLATQMGLEGAFFTNSVASLGVAIPSSPGFVGTYHALIRKALEAFDVNRDAAVAYAFGFHAVNYVSVTAVGLWYFFREGLSWSELEHSEEEMEHDLEEEFETRIEPGLGGNLASDGR